MGYDEFFRWAFRIGKIILENDRYDRKRGEDLLKKLIFDIRAEETPGRFLEKLSESLIEYKMNTNIQADVDLNSNLMLRKWHADSFHYMKSAVITGLFNALSSVERGEENE